MNKRKRRMLEDMSEKLGNAAIECGMIPSYVKIQDGGVVVSFFGSENVAPGEHRRWASVVYETRGSLVYALSHTHNCGHDRFDIVNGEAGFRMAMAIIMDHVGKNLLFEKATT